MADKVTHYAVDIESFGTPENSGYDIIIPNYAIVLVPSNPLKDISHFAYVKLPFQKQIDAGLKVDAGAMNFWMNMCNSEYKDAYAEVASTLSLTESEIISGSSHESYKTKNILDLWNAIRYDPYGKENNIEIWGNDCHFDCSILQANHRKLFGVGELWKYNSPQNARSVRNRLNEVERVDMDSIVDVQLTKFIEMVADHGIHGLELHHPLFDAAREAIQISYCLNVLDPNNVRNTF